MGVCALRRGLTAASKPNQPFLGCCDGSGGLWRARGESASAPLSRTRLRDHVPSACVVSPRARHRPAEPSQHATKVWLRPNRCPDLQYRRWLEPGLEPWLSTLLSVLCGLGDCTAHVWRLWRSKLHLVPFTTNDTARHSEPTRTRSHAHTPYAARGTLMSARVLGLRPRPPPPIFPTPNPPLMLMLMSRRCSCVYE